MTSIARGFTVGCGSIKIGASAVAAPAGGSAFSSALLPLSKIMGIVGDFIQPFERAPPELDVGDFLPHALVFDRAHQQQAAIILNARHACLFGELLGEVKDAGRQV